MDQDMREDLAPAAGIISGALIGGTIWLSILVLWWVA